MFRRHLAHRLAPGLGLVWLSLALLAHPVGAAEPDDYQVQPGDVLLVSVWKEEGLEQEVLVRPDGGLSFPLAGNIDASGKSIAEIEALIASRLEKYIPEPVVTVALRQILGNKIYVIGKVNKPGEFIASSHVDVMQALSMAGGMNPFASANGIKILRRTGGMQEAIPFRYGEVADGRNLEQNIILKSGDIVVVP